VKLCGIGDLKCYEQVIEQNVGQNQQSSCQCLPTCNSISYDVEVERIAISQKSAQAIDDDSVDIRKYKCVPTEEDFDFKNVETGPSTYEYQYQ
jgi:Amiloride-sensitive sodium channel